MREALIALEVEGLVEVRIGSGIYVQRAASGRSDDERPHPRRGRTIRIAARPLRDRSECAALAAKSAKKAQIAAIGEAIGVMQREFDAQVQPFR